METAKVKLLYMIDDLRFGGAQRQMVELIKNVDRRWIEPALAVYKPLRQYAPELEAEGVPIVAIPKRFKYSPWYLARLTAYIRRHEPDIIHSFLQTPNFWARVAGGLGRCPTIITSVRNSQFPQRGLERFLSRLSYKIIVNSTATLANLLQVGVPAEKIVVIYNGIDTRRFAPDAGPARMQARRDYGLPDDRKVFTLVGKFETQKNHDCLITALGEVRRSHAVLPLTLFVGASYDPALRHRLETRVSTEGLSDHVRFVPPTTRIERIYALSDVVVLPSLWEGCANVLLESFACGVPVICSDIAENAALVRHGEDGFLFRNNDPQALAAIIMNVMTMGHETLEQMRAGARRRVVQDFSLQQLATRTMAVYSEALARPKAQRARRAPPHAG